MTGHNEELVATALGYTAHLVLLLSEYLSVSLLYEINFMASRTHITDLSLPDSAEKEYSLLTHWTNLLGVVFLSMPKVKKKGNLNMAYFYSIEMLKKYSLLPLVNYWNLQVVETTWAQSNRYSQDLAQP